MPRTLINLLRHSNLLQDILNNQPIPPSRITRRQFLMIRRANNIDIDLPLAGVEEDALIDLQLVSAWAEELLDEGMDARLFARA